MCVVYVVSSLRLRFTSEQFLPDTQHSTVCMPKLHNKHAYEQTEQRNTGGNRASLHQNDCPLNQ